MPTDQRDMEIVGVVKLLYRYPVKSMAAEALTAIDVEWHGLAGDRRYAFARSGVLSGFPWLSANKLPRLLRYRPAFADPERPAGSTIQVQTPDGCVMRLDSAELAAELAQAHGAPVQLAQLDRGTFDNMCLSLISETTVAALGAATGRDLDPLRFRPNIVIETIDPTPFLEDTWVGDRLMIGDGPDAFTMQVNLRDVRCAMVNLDPATAEVDARVLKTIVRQRENCAGIYATVHRPGTIHVGDPVRRVIHDGVGPA